MIQELDSVIEATSPSVKGEKRKLESSEIKASAPKKIVLNRNPSVSSDTQNGSAATDTAGESKNTESNEKKIVKLSELSVKEVCVIKCVVEMSYIYDRENPTFSGKYLFICFYKKNGLYAYIRKEYLE